ncbi:MAG: T9SS type A sorting domain-containing protein, partial [candidate division WOR-3 bacterium]
SGQVSSGQYLAWTKKENGLSHLYYGAIPASGTINPIEVNYSTDLISYPQILFNPKPPSIDLVWTEYSEIDSIGTIYYLNLPITEVAPKYAFDMGTETPVPILVQRDRYKVLGTEDYKTFDYDSTELVYHLTLHSPHTKYKVRWTWYHEEGNKIHLQFNIDDIFHHNKWVKPGEKIIEESWIPDACIHDNEITIKVKLLNGTVAVLSGFEIYAEEVGGGGPQGEETKLTSPFYFDRLYPNPAKGVIRLRFNSPDERKITIKIYDVCGRLVNEKNIIKSKIGMNELLITPKDLSAGVYFVRLETDGYQKVEKAILLR